MAQVSQRSKVYICGGIIICIAMAIGCVHSDSQFVKELSIRYAEYDKCDNITWLAD